MSRFISDEMIRETIRPQHKRREFAEFQQRHKREINKERRERDRHARRKDKGHSE